MKRILEDKHIDGDLLHKEKTYDASKGVWLYTTIKTQRPLENKYA